MFSYKKAPSRNGWGLFLSGLFCYPAGSSTSDSQSLSWAQDQPSRNAAYGVIELGSKGVKVDTAKDNKLGGTAMGKVNSSNILINGI